MNLSNIATLKIKNLNYRRIISGISKAIKSEAIKLLKNIDLTEKEEHYIYKKSILRGILKLYLY